VIVRLKLNDIDWYQGVMQIRSKGARVDALPLPKTTGEAIAHYLEHRDAEHATGALFLRLKPPFDRAVTADTIRGSLRNAAKRCGLSDRLTGPHKLRHTLAIRLVNSGVSLKEISDVMRHRDLDTTTIYAKVDMRALSAVTSCWPEKYS
jgi:site-specific recombinase XerD